MPPIDSVLGVISAEEFGRLAAEGRDWRARERDRFARKKYKLVPWADAEWVHREGPIADHFVHVSEKDPYMLAYTPSATDGERDRRVPIKPGRYLQRFYADRLSPEEIARHAATVRGSGIRVELTNSISEMQAIYAGRGMSACMSHSASHYMGAKFNGGLHPLAAYADSDLRLAWAKAPGGEAIARAIVWPARKIYSRCYGDTAAFRKALDADGWHSGLLDGACLKAIPLNADAYHYVHRSAKAPHFSGPYVDHVKWARWDPEAKTLTLQTRATGATHSVQHGDGILYPIDVAPNRPAGMTAETIAQEHARLVALEAAGTPEPTPKLSEPAYTAAQLLNEAMGGHVALGAGIGGIPQQAYWNNTLATNTAQDQFLSQQQAHIYQNYVARPQADLTEEAIAALYAATQRF